MNIPNSLMNLEMYEVLKAEKNWIYDGVMFNMWQKVHLTCLAKISGKITSEVHLERILENMPIIFEESYEDDISRIVEQMNASPFECCSIPLVFFPILPCCMYV